MGWPCLSRFLLPRQRYAAFPFLLASGDFIGCGLGLGFLASVVFAQLPQQPQGSGGE
jgi:hypothetical protein